jgi:hypothetical protein
MPDSRLVRIPGAGHFFPVVKPAMFARALTEFLGRDEDSAPARLRAARARRLVARTRRRALSQ